MSKVLLITIAVLTLWCVVEQIINLIKSLKDEYKKQNDCNQIKSE